MVTRPSTTRRSWEVLEESPAVVDGPGMTTTIITKASIITAGTILVEELPAELIQVAAGVAAGEEAILVEGGVRVIVGEVARVIVEEAEAAAAVVVVAEGADEIETSSVQDVFIYCFAGYMLYVSVCCLLRSSNKEAPGYVVALLLTSGVSEMFVRSISV